MSRISASFPLDSNRNNSRFLVCSSRIKPSKKCVRHWWFWIPAALVCLLCWCLSPSSTAFLHINTFSPHLAPLRILKTRFLLFLHTWTVYIICSGVKSSSLRSWIQQDSSAALWFSLREQIQRKLMFDVWLLSLSQNLDLNIFSFHILLPRPFSYVLLPGAEILEPVDEDLISEESLPTSYSLFFQITSHVFPQDWRQSCCFCHFFLFVCFVAQMYSQLRRGNPGGGEMLLIYSSWREISQEEVFSRLFSVRAFFFMV